MPVRRSRSRSKSKRGGGCSADHHKRGARRSMRRSGSKRGGGGCGWTKDKRRSLRRKGGRGHNNHTKSHGHGRKRVLVCDGADCPAPRKLFR